MNTEKLKECPFCGHQVKYIRKEQRIECENCRARVWFDDGTDADEEEIIERNTVHQWNERGEKLSLADRIYRLAGDEMSKFQLKLWDLAKYAQLAAELENSKRLIEEIKLDLDGIDINKGLIKLADAVDRQLELHHESSY